MGWVFLNLSGRLPLSILLRWSRVPMRVGLRYMAQRAVRLWSRWSLRRKSACVWDEARDGYEAGVQFVDVVQQSRQGLYDLELEAFVAAIRGTRAPDRSYEHELLVQETVLRGVGRL